MKDESANPGGPAVGATSALGLPAAVDRAAFQAELDGLRAREKAHTQEGDAIAAARRRLPMTEVDASLPLAGSRGPLTLLQAFEGRRQLIAYYFMWWAGHPAAEQCEGCTWVTTQVAELSYLHSRDITYAVFCQGPYDESSRYRDFMGWDMPWYSALDSLDHLLTGRQTGLFHLVCYLRDGDRVSKPTGPNAAAPRPWTTATRSWTSPCTDARRPGRIRPPAGRSSAPSRGLTAARPPGRQCQRGRADAPSPSGRAWQPGALTTLPLGPPRPPHTYTAQVTGGAARWRRRSAGSGEREHAGKLAAALPLARMAVLSARSEWQLRPQRSSELTSMMPVPARRPPTYRAGA